MATFMAALHERAATPITPLHSPHPSLHSQSSLGSHSQSLSLHEYRKQLSSSCTPDLVGSKRIKRKTATSSLKPAKHSPRVTFAEPGQLLVDSQRSSGRKLQGDEAQPLLAPTSPDSPVLESSRDKHASYARNASLQDTSKLLERPLSFAKKLASRKRLPRPDNINLTGARPRASFHSENSSIDVQSSAEWSDSSTFTLSKYPFPQPPSRVNIERFSGVNILPASPHLPQDATFTLPDTPPATPATLHYRGTSFDVVNPRKSLYNSNFEPPEDPDLETGSEFFDRFPTLKGLLPGEMAADSDSPGKKADSKQEHQGRKVFADFESAYASIAQQKVHGPRDECLQPPERRIFSVPNLDATPVGRKPSNIETPRSFSANHPNDSAISSPIESPRGTSFMNRVKERILGSPTKSTHEKEQELQEFHGDGTPVKSSSLDATLDEAPHDSAFEEEAEDYRPSLDNSAWESVSERPSERPHSLAPSSVYPDSNGDARRNSDRPFSFVPSSVYRQSDGRPGSLYFGPLNNRGSIPWGVRNKATDYSNEVSTDEDMWRFKSNRNSLQEGLEQSHGFSHVNNTTLGSIIDRYGDDGFNIGKPTGSSVATSFEDTNENHNSAGVDENDSIRLSHVQSCAPVSHHVSTPKHEVAVLNGAPPSESPPDQTQGRSLLPRLRINVHESRIGAPPLQSPPPMGSPSRPRFFAVGSTELSGQGSYGDTNRLLNIFPGSPSPVSDLSVGKRYSLQSGDRLPESPLQSIIDQCSTQSSPMDRQDPFYLENALKAQRDSWESCSSQSSGGGILGEAGISFVKRPATPASNMEASAGNNVDHGQATGEILTAWASKVSPNVKSQKSLHVNDANSTDIPAIWARKVSPNAKSQRTLSQPEHAASSAGLRADTESEWITDEGVSEFQSNYGFYHSVSPDVSPAQVKGKQALRRKRSFDELSPDKSVDARLVPKRSDTNPWRNKKKSAATDVPVEMELQEMPRFPRESQLVADSCEGDISVRQLSANIDYLPVDVVPVGDDGPQIIPSSPPALPLEHPSGLSGFETPEMHRHRAYVGISPPSSSPLARQPLLPGRGDLTTPRAALMSPTRPRGEDALFYSPTADGIDAAFSARSSMAAVFPGASYKGSKRAVTDTPSVSSYKVSRKGSPSLASSTGDHGLDHLRYMRRLRPRASSHYEDTLAQRRMEERRRVSEKLDERNLAEKPKTSLHGGKVDPLHPRAAVRGQKSVLPLRLHSQSAVQSTTSFGTQQIRRHRRPSDIEAGRDSLRDQPMCTPTTMGEPERHRSPKLAPFSRPASAEFVDVVKLKKEISWKIFWSVGWFGPCGLLLYFGYFDTLMFYFTEGEIELVGAFQKKLGLAVAIGECVALLLVFYVLKMCDVV
ncbi:hypothetical protein JOL62DRAFT_555659 [Phyllosticta paracitricarpa]|uniref:Uncharacterized protein n=1 Tax=Phyllosticta paracitricarpa TaxID=2016321 RepID=A0ABR1NAJ5_9PEZI